MTRILILKLGIILGLLAVPGCNAASERAVAPTPAATLEVVAENESLPTPMPPAQMAVYDEIRVVMKEAEITSSYLTEYGSEREPPAGKNIIWINILLKNIGEREEYLPESENFSVLMGVTEFKSTYGHRKDHADYMALPPDLVPGQAVDAWLRFDIPAGLGLEDLMFAFHPESSQISFGFPSSDYPWGDHPVYLWTCSP